MSDIRRARDALVANISSLWRSVTPLYPASDVSTTERLPDTTPLKWADTAKLIELSPDRTKKYNDYKEMDEEVVELSSALDLYADFVVSGAQESDESYNFDSDSVSEALRTTIKDFEERLELKSRVWWMAREVCKFGDAFYEVIATMKNIVKLQKLPVETIWYNFDKNGKIDVEFPYVQKEYEGAMQNIAKFAPWEIVHFKVGEELYGVNAGVLAKLRRLYRVERMLEDSMLINRLTRAHQRLIYKIDVSNMGVMEAIAYIRRLKRLNRRRRYVDSEGKLKMEENPMAPQEDIYQPVRRGGVGDIDVIQADTSVAAIADIEHFHNKLFSGTKVPKAYLGFERDVNAKATLVQQSLAFTKVVRRMRSVVAKGLRKLYRLEMILHGINPNTVSFKLRFPGFGVADEELRWKIEQYKSTIVRNYVEAGIDLPTEWVVRHLMFGLSQAEANELLSLLKKHGPMVPKKKARAGAPAVPTGRPPSGGRTTSPTGPEDSVDLAALVNRVGGDGKLQDMVDELRHILRTGRTRPELY